MNGLYPPTLDDEIIYAMKQAGFKTLNLSLVTVSLDQLKRFHRPDVTNSFDNALQLVEKHKLEAVGYIIAGAPFQRPETSIEDLLFLAKRRVLAGVSIFYPSPGSSDYRLCGRINILPKHFSLMRSSALPISHLTTREHTITILRLGRILNFMKSLLDNGFKLPDPKPFKEAKILNLKDRTEIGIKLLQWFFYDGKIRGVVPDGAVYEHAVSTDLTLRFIDGLNRIHIRGVRGM